jgi:phenylpropionate dioxygenase-like ring-hydroxylating dioxygenase large terminal subunit
MMIGVQKHLNIGITATATAIVFTSTKSKPLLFQQRQQPQKPSHWRIISQQSQRYSSNNSNDKNDNQNDNPIDLSMLEEHVLASVQSQMDTTRVLQALSVDEPLARIHTNTPTYTKNSNDYNTYNINNNNNSNNGNNRNTPLTPHSITDLLYEYETPPLLQQQQATSSQFRRPVSTFQISLAAAMVCGTITWIVIHNSIIAVLISISVFMTAFMDDDDTTTTTTTSWSNNNLDNNNNNITGALARILGRTTIRSVQASEPKIKAIARVVITGKEDIQYLQQTIQILQQENQTLQRENAQLQQWKQKHSLIHQIIFPNYTLAQLKDLAKLHQLPVSGTKLELIERLLDANILQLPLDNEMNHKIES